MEDKPFDSLHLLILCIVTLLILAVCWLGFCITIWKSGGKLEDILQQRTPFLENLTVSLVVLATATLGLAGVLKGELVATLFGGIVGYVLGNIRGRRNQEEPPRASDSGPQHQESGG